MKVFGGDLDVTLVQIYEKFVCSELKEELHDIVKDCNIESLTFRGKNKLNILLNINFRKDWLELREKYFIKTEGGLPINKIGLLSQTEYRKMVEIFRKNFNLTFSYRPEIIYITIP